MRIRSVAKPIRSLDHSPGTTPVFFYVFLQMISVLVMGKTCLTYEYAYRSKAYGILEGYFEVCLKLIW